MGITASIATALEFAGVGAETAAAIAPIAVGVGGGAALGAGTAALTGGDPGMGALGGAITGGFIPAGGELGGAIGIGATGGEIAGGLAGGALGAGVTGRDPVTGALMGAGSGTVTAALSGGFDPSTTPPGAAPGTGQFSAPGAGVGGPGTGAVPAPAGVTAPSPDVTAAAPTGGGSFSDFMKSLNPFGDTAAPGAVPSSGGGTPITPSPNPPSVTAAPLESAAPVAAPSLGGTDIGQPLAGADTTFNVPHVAPTAAPAAAAPAAPSSFSTFLKNPTTGSFFDMLGKNANLLVPAAGLGIEALTQPTTLGAGDISASAKALTSEARALGTQGQTLASYLSSGTLPPGVQAGLDQAAEAAKAAIRSRYAAMGSSGSSSEQQELSNVDMTVQAQGAQIATNLLSQGVSEENMASNLYKIILDESLAQNQQLSSAIGNFAMAAAGGSPTFQLKAG